MRRAKALQNTRAPAARVTAPWVTLRRLAEESERVVRQAPCPRKGFSDCQMTLGVCATVCGPLHRSTPKYRVPAILKLKTLQHRKSCPEHVKNLCCACYLPVEVFAAKRHFQSKYPCPLMRIHHHDKIFHGKSERAIVEPEVSCSAHKLLEIWNRIGQLIEELDLKPLEERDGDSRKKRFQVSAGT